MVALLVGLLWVSAAAAAPFTATWDDAPTNRNLPIPPSPFYECGGWGAGGLTCSWLWDQGLEVREASPQFGFPMYGDGGPFYDAFGPQLSLESDISENDVLLGIVPKCQTGLQPCISTFTPQTIVVSSSFTRAPGGVFFLSSRGGLITSQDGEPVTFAGAEWTDITGMGIGLYRLDACGDPDSELDCGSGEQNFSIESLTFDATPVPEPASMLLVGAGLLAVLKRYRRSA